MTPRDHLELLRAVAASPKALMALGTIREAAAQRPGYKRVTIREMRPRT